MSISDVLADLDEEERLLYLSATDVKHSAFWKHLMEKLTEIGDANKGALLQSTMTGHEKEAIIAACKIQVIGAIMEIMDGIIEDVTVNALNQEQEEENAR